MISSRADHGKHTHAAAPPDPLAQVCGRHYAAGAMVHALVALVVLALGYAWGVALLIPAFVLALLAVRARRRGTFIETVTSPPQPPVLYADGE